MIVEFRHKEKQLTSINSDDQLVIVSDGYWGGDSWASSGTPSKRRSTKGGFTLPGVLQVTPPNNQEGYVSSEGVVSDHSIPENS